LTHPLQPPKNIFSLAVYQNRFAAFTGLEKTQVLLKKPAGRLNAGFSGKSGFFTENVHIWGQYQ
jgi:hypothetical protein